MSSRIEIIKICEFCKKEFMAKTTVTRFCGHPCASKSYKQRKKQNKLGWANEQTNESKVLLASEVNYEIVKSKEFLSIKEVHQLLGVSERTIFRLMKSGKISYNKIGRRTIIKKDEINNFLTNE